MQGELCRRKRDAVWRVRPPLDAEGDLHFDSNIVGGRRKRCVARNGEGNSPGARAAHGSTLPAGRFQV
jgi:hypothetical protein